MPPQTQLLVLCADSTSAILQQVAGEGAQVDGIRTCGQLHDDGLTRRTIDHLTRVDELTGIRQLESVSDCRLDRIHAALAVAPADAVLSGWAAAVVHGVPSDFLDGTWDGKAMMPVQFSVPAKDGARRRRGVRLHWSTVPLEHTVRYQGRLVTNSLRTAVDLARWSRTPARALAAVDLSLRHGLTTAQDLQEFLPMMKRRQGMPLVRAAVSVGTVDAESPKESELRYYWLQSGLPAPIVNAWIYDLRGMCMGRVDLLEPVSGYVAEFNGHWHEMWDRPALDANRNAGLRSLNLTLDEFTRFDVGGNGQCLLAERMLSGYAKAQQRDPRHDAWFCPEAENWVRQTA